MVDLERMEMRFKKNTKFVICLICASIVLAFSAIQNYQVMSEQNVAVETEPGFMECADNQYLTLYVAPENGSFYVLDKRTGSKWYSNPPGRTTDQFAFGIFKMEMSALLNVSFYNKSMGSENKVNSFTGSVYDENFTISYLSDGYRCEFRFAEIGLMIPIEIRIDGEELAVRISTKDIKLDNPDIFIDSIDVLQYFCSGSPEEEGYLLVPDGSGGLIFFDNGKYSAGEYSRPVYGSDPGDLPDEYDLKTDDTRISLPVFGIKRGDDACLAILEDSAELASVKANCAYQITGYANVYSGYQLYSRMKYSLAGNETELYENHNKNLRDISLRYLFLADEEANYSGMARAYRNHLNTNEMFPESNDLTDTCFVTLYGGVVKKISRLGLVFERVVPLTTVSDIETIAVKMKESGIDRITVNYVNWNRQELKQKQISRMEPAGALAGPVDISVIASRADINLYATVRNALQYSKGGIFSRFTDAVRNISGQAVRLYEYSLSLGKPVKGKNYYLLTVPKIADKIRDIAESADDKGFSSIGFSDMGNTLYNDHRKGTYKRYDTKDEIIESMTELKAVMPNVLMESPNMYSLKFASDITNIPFFSSKQLLIDKDIPFYQMVLSGRVRYATTPLNLVPKEDALLKLLETSSMMHYEGFYAGSSLTKGTSLSTLCNGNYEQFLSMMAEQYTKVMQAREIIGVSTIYSHDEVSRDVYVTRFENGKSIYVNYGYSDHELSDGSIVPARGYIIK